MYKLVSIIILSVLLFLGYQYYENLKQQSELELQRENYEQEKQVLEKARATKSPRPLSEFIQQYPDSVWLDSAIYYRDKYAVQQLIKSGDTQKLQDFINNNPSSEWVASARQHLVKLVREQENRAIQQRILNNQPKVDLSEIKIPSLTDLENTEQPETETETEKVEQPAPVKKANRNDPAERVKRALSIYQKMGKQQIRSDVDRQKQQAEEEKRIQACNRLKDQLKELSRRGTRWYKLDESGNRVYMRKEAVALKKKEVKTLIEEKCP